MDHGLGVVVIAVVVIAVVVTLVLGAEALVGQPRLARLHDAYGAQDGALVLPALHGYSLRMFFFVDAAIAADQFVLVRVGAVLRAGSTEFSLVTTDAAPAAMQLVGEQGDTLTVRPLRNGDALQCSNTRLSPAADLRLDVSRADLVPVLTQSWTQAWKDGTSVRFRAGTPLTVQADGRWLASADGVALVVGVPEASVGTSYEVDAGFPAWKMTSPSLAMGAAIRTGGGALTLRGNTNAAVTATQKSGRVEAVARCVAVVGDVAEGDLQAGMGAVGIGGLFGGRAPNTRKARAGTALTWADGWPAGELVEETSFNPKQGTGLTTCLEFKLGQGRFDACMDSTAAE